MNPKSGLQAIIDRTHEGTFSYLFGESGVNLERRLHHVHRIASRYRGKVGKCVLAFGKVNMMHNHVLPWVVTPAGHE